MPTSGLVFGHLSHHSTAYNKLYLTMHAEAYRVPLFFSGQCFFSLPMKDVALFCTVQLLFLSLVPKILVWG